MQSIPKDASGQVTLKRDEEVRNSGTGTAGYQRPQGYVRKALNSQNSRSNLDVTQDKSLERN